MHLFLIFLLFLLSGCGDNRQQAKAPIQAKGEYIYRLHNEFLYTAEAPTKKEAEPYPWLYSSNAALPKITKEYFRCKGSTLNPAKSSQVKNETVRYFDCGGTERHSLPMRDGKEFVYPILINLLNHIQTETGKKVVITSGHRCPDHNNYLDPSPKNQCSKHLIGAEVSFYVQGLETKPDAIVKIIQDYYKGKPKELQEFQRYEKNDTNVSTAPWYNKEIFIKLFRKEEGRDFDNRHPYPYLSIQVRYDLEKNERVTVTWDKAYNNYLRR